MSRRVEEIELEHNEVLQKVNLDTGEVKSGLSSPKINNNLTKLKTDAPFNKVYPIGWEYLASVINDRQYKLAIMLSYRVKPITNSLIPYNDDTTIRMLAKELKMNKNTIKKDLEMLFEKGVYGKFELYEHYVAHSKYWVFNPYLSYNGAWIDKSTQKLFEKTTIALIVKGDLAKAS